MGASCASGRSEGEEEAKQPSVRTLWSARTGKA
jgi:hypothetical protein